jgi:predicted ATPase
LAALSHLAPHLPTSRAFIILTCRTAEARERAAVWKTLETVDRAIPWLRLRLRPLERADGIALVERALGTGDADSQATAFAERLQDETGGNALFLVESLKLLLEQGELARSSSGEWAFPAQDLLLPILVSVQKIIGGRLMRLTATPRAVLEVVAVLGERVSFTVLSRVSNLPPAVLLAALEELGKRGFLVEAETHYQFEHDRVQEVVYNGITPKRRRRLHRQAGEALETLQSERAGALAFHFERGQVWDKAAFYNNQAGDRARAAYANDEAIAHYTRALEALDRQSEDDPSQRFGLLLACEAVNALQGKRESQLHNLESLEMLVEALDDDQKCAVAALRWAEYHTVMSEFAASKKMVEKAIRCASRSGDFGIEAKGHFAQGRALWMQAHHALARACYERALVLTQQVGDRLDEARCLHSLGVIHFDLDEYRPALDFHQRALSIYHELGDLRREADSLNGLANVYDAFGEVALAQECYEQSLAIKRAIGDRQGESVALYNLAVHHRDAGEAELARRYCEESLAIAQDIDSRRLVAYVLTYLGLIEEKLHTSEPASRADLAAAKDHYAQALAIREEIGQWALANDSRAGLARVALTQGWIDEALACVEESLGWISEHGVGGVGDIQLVYLTAYRVFTAAKRYGQARAIIEAAHDLLLAWGADLDEKGRRSLLEGVWPHSEIAAIYHMLHGEPVVQQTQVRLPAAGVPTGRPLREDDLVLVTWTVAAPEDDEIGSKTARRRHRLLRLLREATEQSAAPTVENLAAALNVSGRTIKRDLAALRAEGHDVRTRGARS